MKANKIFRTAFAVAMAAMVTLTGCAKTESGNTSAKTEGGKIKISFLNGFTGGDGEYMRKITDGFNASQDVYEVVESQEKDHYVKFKSADYDLVVIHGDRLKTYSDDKMIQEVSSIYEKAGLKLDDFIEAGQDIVKLDGSIFAFPLDIHPLVMFYNKELVKEAPKTYEDIVKLQAELTKQDSNLYAMGIPGLGLAEFYYMTMANQNGIDLQEGESLNFANDSFADSLLKLNQMIYTDKVSPGKLGLDGEFKTFVQDESNTSGSKTALALTGPWYYAAAKEKYGNNLGIAPVPVLGNQAGVYGNAHTIAVSAAAKSEDTIAGIAEFLKYMYQPDALIHWADAGQAPLHKATMEAIQQKADQYPLALANYEQFPHCRIAPQVYNVGEQFKYMNESILNMIVSTPDLTKEQLMVELEKATKTAKQVSKGL